MPQDLPSPRRAEARKEFELTGRHVLAIFIAFFTVVASVNFYMMRLAIGTMPGLDARNGYDVSQRFNGYIAEAEAQAARRWTADGELRNEAGALAIRLAFAAPEAGATEGLTVSVRLEHPSNRSFDQVVRLAEEGPGRYVARVPGRHTGAWTVVIEARATEGGPLLYASRNRTVIKG